MYLTHLDVLNIVMGNRRKGGKKWERKSRISFSYKECINLAVQLVDNGTHPVCAEHRIRELEYDEIVVRVLYLLKKDYKGKDVLHILDMCRLTGPIF